MRYIIAINPSDFHTANIFSRYDDLTPAHTGFSVRSDGHLYAADQAQVLKDIEPLTKRERVSYLTGKSAAYTAQMMQRWDKLFRLIAVKHNDQIMKPSENGTVVPGRYTTPGYDQQYREQISKDTGTRYLMPENTGDIKSL